MTKGERLILSLVVIALLDSLFLALAKRMVNFEVVSEVVVVSVVTIAIGLIQLYLFFRLYKYVQLLEKADK